MIVGQISLGSFLRVKDPLKPFANARGNVSSGGFVRDPSLDACLALPAKEAASLSFHSTACRRVFTWAGVPHRSAGSLGAP